MQHFFHMQGVKTGGFRMKDDKLLTFYLLWPYCQSKQENFSSFHISAIEQNQDRAHQAPRTMVWPTYRVTKVFWLPQSSYFSFVICLKVSEEGNSRLCWSKKKKKVRIYLAERQTEDQGFKRSADLFTFLHDVPLKISHLTPQINFRTYEVVKNL